MVGKEIFVKRGFEVVDRTPPDFELPAKKFVDEAPTPRFKKGIRDKAAQYPDELTIIRSDQCPYSVKNVREICETAKDMYEINPKVIDLNRTEQAQNDVPCAVGNFCIVYRGKIVAEHPISKRRFMNIMEKERK